MNTAIHQTTDYSIFRKMTGQREIYDLKKVNRIADSMKERGWIGAPALLNENMEVVDGQNRIEAAKIAGIPAWYIIVDGLTIDDCIQLNSTSVNWGFAEYINCYVAFGNTNYIRFKELKDTYLTSYENVIRALNIGRSWKREDIKRGLLSITDEQYHKAHRTLSGMNKIRKACKQIKLSAPGTVLDAACLFIVEHYDDHIVDGLCNSIKRTDADTIPTMNMPILLNSFEKIYNRNRKFENRQYFSEDYKKMPRIEAVKKRRNQNGGAYVKTQYQAQIAL